MERPAPPRDEFSDRPWIRGPERTPAAPTYTTAELYHENSKFHRHLMVQEPMDTAAALAIPRRTGLGHLPLPAPSPDLSCSLGAALRQRRSIRRYQPEVMGIALLADLLFYTAGTTGVEQMNVRGELIAQPIRSYPSGGALFPVDLFVIARQVAGIDPGVYQYEPERHALLSLPIAPTAAEECLGCTPLHPHVVDLTHAQVILALVAHFPRQAAKYRRRAYRFTLQESGHIAQNGLLVATGLGLGAVVLGAYFDDEINRLLHLDGVTESLLYLIPVGRP